MRRLLKLLAAAAIVVAIPTAIAIAASKPTVVTGGTSSVTATSAALHGSVNPNGADTTYYFEWGPTTGYGNKGSVKSAGSGTTAVSAEEVVAHLISGATYHYRLVATNSSGTTDGADRTFVTRHTTPGVTTGPITGLNASGATLTGSISPHNETTSWFFQWGKSGSFSERTATQTIGPTSTPQQVAASLQGLIDPGTVYQYRLVAVHHSVRTNGSTQSFMTYPSARPYAGVRAITTPRHRILFPYAFTTTGTIGRPSWMPSQYACVGEVTIRFYRDFRQVRFETAPVQSDCSYSETSVFNRLPGGGSAPARLKVFVHFVSTQYLANGRPAHDRVTVR